MGKPKIITVDLETLPEMRQVMKYYPKLSQYPGTTLKANLTSALCFSYKELDVGKKAEIVNAWDFKTRWAKNINDDSKLIEAAYEIIKDADVVVAHNGRRFDYKFLNTRLVKHGLPLLPNKIKYVDTCAEARKNFLMTSNSLAALTEFFEIGEKLENGGWELWEKIMWEKDPEAMKLMSEYCKRDVEITEPVFKLIRANITGLPNWNNFTEEPQKVCKTCGHFDLNKNGTRIQKNGLHQAYVCKVCGSVGYVKLMTLKPILK